MSQTTAGTTSGTVLGQRFNVARVMEHAFRRANYIPQKITSEWIGVARDLLFLQLCEYANAGFPLWTRQLSLLPIFIGSADVTTPYGTVDVIHVYWRIFNPWRGAAFLTTGADGSDLFSGEPGDDVTIVNPNPGVIVDFSSATEVDTVGILPGAGADYTASLVLLTSEDGVTYTTVKTLPSTTFTAGQWAYFDLSPSVSAEFLQIRRPGSTDWVLNQVNFCLANSTQVDLGKQNIDDYYDLPNQFEKGGQPNTAYVDRQRDQPVIKIWPTPNDQAFYNGTIVSLQRRYIEDVGLMTDTLEVPARWFEGVVARLAVRLMDELPEMADAQASPLSAAAKAQRRDNNDKAAIKAEAMMWSEERDKSPMRIMPNIRPYTI